MFFAHLKCILKLARLRLRVRCGGRDEFHLAAAAQNLRKMAKLIARAQARDRLRGDLRALVLSAGQCLLPSKADFFNTIHPFQTRLPGAELPQASSYPADWPLKRIIRMTAAAINMRANPRAKPRQKSACCT